MILVVISVEMQHDITRASWEREREIAKSLPQGKKGKQKMSKNKIKCGGWRKQTNGDNKIIFSQPLLWRAALCGRKFFFNK